MSFASHGVKSPFTVLSSLNDTSRPIRRMSFVSPRRRIRRWLLPLLTLTIIFLVVFVDFDSTGTLDTRIGDEDEGRPKQKKTRRIVEKWNADYGETEVEPDQAPPLLERTRVGWEKEEDMPKTKILRHVPGKRSCVFLSLDADVSLLVQGGPFMITYTSTKEPFML